MGFRPSSHTGSQWSDTEKKSSASDERGNIHTKKKRPFLTVKIDNNTLKIKDDGY